MTIVARPYGDSDDYARIRTLLEESYRISGPPDNASVGDLDWWNCTDEELDPISAARLWITEDDCVVAVAWPSGSQVDLLTHPQHCQLEDEMLAWAETELRDSASAGEEPPEIEVYAFAKDNERRELLAASGYTQTDEYHNYRTRSLETIPEQSVAEGYTLRNVGGEEDLGARVAVHRDAFAPSKMSVEKHRRVMESPTYRRDLDIVAVAPDGTFAAFCIVWYDEANRNGLFEPVGCHSEHRQRGLASAVMCEGMRRVRVLGAATVNVVSSGSELSANRLYDSLGFTLVDRHERWTKSL
jgi:ribosomal protein S18 acetylase RimI-like enzyme